MRELTTERLLLRRVRQEDVPRIFDCWAGDPEVTRYLTWNPHESQADTEQIMAHWLAEYDKPDCYRYGIELRATGELIGMIDVVHFKDGEPAIGYCSGKAYWGNGYMTEALCALCRELFDDGYPSVFIQAIEDNIGSNRVIRKAGFQFLGARREKVSAAKPVEATVCSYRLYAPKKEQA